MSFILVSYQAHTAEAKTSNAQEIKIHYDISFLPNKDRARVKIEIDNSDALHWLDFNLSTSQCKAFQSDDALERRKTRLQWRPSTKNSELNFHCKIKHQRKSKKKGRFYDAYINRDWVIVRGDDLVPPARVSSDDGTRASTTMTVTLPKEWTSVRTGWPQLSQTDNTTTFRIDNPHRLFDRPTGWIIAGKLGTRMAKVKSPQGSMDIQVSAPKQSDFRRMDTLAFLNVVMPEVNQALKPEKEKLLIIGAGKPMWRGGLSAGNSFYVHQDRPLISGNGTSTLLHELFHMVTGIQGDKNSDWIAEGLAEYYSVEFLRRSGLSSKHRQKQTLKNLQAWSKNVDSVIKEKSSGEITAASVLIFYELNKEIKKKTKGKDNLDTLTRALMVHANNKTKISLEILKKEFEALTQSQSSTLSGSLLKSQNI